MKRQAELVVSLLNKHRYDSILVATDADREGEIIARECLEQAKITDFSRIKRFWVSQALTPEVIRKGIKAARSLSEYDELSKKDSLASIPTGFRATTSPVMFQSLRAKSFRSAG